MIVEENANTIEAVVVDSRMKFLIRITHNMQNVILRREETIQK